MQCLHVTSKNNANIISFNNKGNVRVTWHWGAFVPPLLQWKNNKYHTVWVCVCSRSYPACNAHAPYCHLCPVRLCNIFSTVSHKRHHFPQKVMEHKMCFDFIYNFFLKLGPRRAANRIQLLYVHLERAHKPSPFHIARTLSRNTQLSRSGW